jgi:hypothetical protein
MRRPPGSSGLKYPLGLLESSRYNSFFKAETMGVVIEIRAKYPKGAQAPWVLNGYHFSPPVSRSALGTRRT